MFAAYISKVLYMFALTFIHVCTVGTDFTGKKP